MKHHKEVDALIAQAEAAGICIYGRTKSHCSALIRRAKELELKRVFPNMYVKPEYWNALKPDERIQHVACTLHLKHPNWVFAGVTAAALHGFEHPWHLHAGSVTIATASQGTNANNANIKRVFVPHCAPEYVNGIPVTNGAQTVVDCGLSTDFRFALPIIDSALRKGTAIADILNICSTMHRDCTPIFRLLHYANPASENDGRLIVGEYDGYEKYTNPNMNDRRGIQGAVHAEKERETGLYRAKVDSIVRFTYEDVLKQHPMINKLRAAGVPDATMVMR